MGRDHGRLVVLNIGTAGALRDGMGGIYLPGTAVNHDMNAEAIRALGYDPQETLPIHGGDDTILASGDVFVTDPLVRAGPRGGEVGQARLRQRRRLRRRLAKRGCVERAGAR